METTIVKGPSHLQQSRGEFEDASPTSSMRDQSSTSALVTMIACGVILLAMLWA